MSRSWPWRVYMMWCAVCFGGLQVGCFEPTPVYASYHPSSPGDDAASASAPQWGLVPELYVVDIQRDVSHPHEPAPHDAAKPRPDEPSPEAPGDTPSEPEEPVSERLIGVININTATPEQLQLLPRVGAAMSQRIVDHRGRRAFTRPAHLRRVKGIGKATYARFAMHLVVEGDTTLRAR